MKILQLHNDEMHHKFKMLAVKQRITMVEAIETAISDYIEKHNVPLPSEFGFKVPK